MTNQFDQTKLDRALVSIERLNNVLSEWLELQLTLLKIFIILSIVLPIATVIFSAVIIGFLWFLGDALLKAL